jgi:hypothetical protein
MAGRVANRHVAATSPDEGHGEVKFPQAMKGRACGLRKIFPACGTREALAARAGFQSKVTFFDRFSSEKAERVWAERPGRRPVDFLHESPPIEAVK